MANLRLYIAGIALFGAISAAFIKAGETKPQPTQTVTANTSQTLTAGSSPSPAATPPTPAEQQKIIWGYFYDPKLLPYPDWQKTLEKGTAYRLYDENHKCIGRVLADGKIQLIHQFPQVCDRGNS